MKLSKLDLLISLLILIISSLVCLELFLFQGRPATFDAKTHIATIAQFSQVLSSGEFPVVWLNNFATNGIPVGIISHQTTSYLGGLLNIFVSNPELTFNILIFVSVLLTNIFFYVFLRKYFTKASSFLGILLFSFSFYRIFNIYVRGALPELFSSIFLPLILLSMYIFIVRKKTYGLFLISLFVLGLTLTHPMMLIVYSAVFIPYLLYLIISSKQSRLKLTIISLSSIILGVLMASYYILPLNLETKYFYFGLEKDHFNYENFLSFNNYFGSNFEYFSKSEIFTRAHNVIFGVLESLALVSGFAFYIYKKLIQKNKEDLKLLEFLLITVVINIFFTIQLSEIFYRKVFFLNSIQFPWRFLSSLVFIPPILVAYFYDKFPRKILYFVIVLFVCVLSFPQIYGKNNTNYPASLYYYLQENAYSINMNTIWSGRSEDYPKRKTQTEIIDGNGKLENINIKNSKRSFEVDAKTNLRIVDYTFYFPGWSVYVDGAKTNIEFQDSDYRGIITYQVPAGKHSVTVVFEDTKIRFISRLLSVLFLGAFIFLFVFRKKIGNVLN